MLSEIVDFLIINIKVIPVAGGAAWLGSVWAKRIAQREQGWCTHSLHKRTVTAIVTDPRSRIALSHVPD